jgi:hypothetical protein
MKSNVIVFVIFLFTTQYLCSSNIISTENRKIPKGYKISQPKIKQYTIEGGNAAVYSQGFRQGDACYIEISPTHEKNSKISIQNYHISYQMRMKYLIFN